MTKNEKNDLGGDDANGGRCDLEPAARPELPHVAPIRVQRSRAKGWKMPENTVYVGRPGKFGNPFEVKRFGLEAAIQLYRNAVEGYWSAGAVPQGCSVEIAYQDHLEVGRQLRRAGYIRTDIAYAIRSELRGKNLACWCPLDQPCHADVLLELANQRFATGNPSSSGTSGSFPSEA